MPYKLGPAGATFDPPLIFTWNYDPDTLPEGTAWLVIVYYDEETGEWVELPCTVDPVNHIITASVAHFTTFAIIGTVPPMPPLPPPVEPEPPEVVPVEPPPEEPVELEEPEEPEVVEPEEPIEPEKPEVIEPEKPSYLWAYILGGVFAAGGIALFGLWRRKRKKEEND
ncbi:unnamed protein product [marine sediment metagenome]|uniref:Uncharacterized protein n=1 Tax=marine sediment metagenome TaxID=412755 RepID=X1PYD2_9ZZZZ